MLRSINQHKRWGNDTYDRGASECMREEVLVVGAKVDKNLPMPRLDAAAWGDRWGGCCWGNGRYACCILQMVFQWQRDLVSIEIVELSFYLVWELNRVHQNGRESAKLEVSANHKWTLVQLALNPSNYLQRKNVHSLHNDDITMIVYEDSNYTG